MSSATLSGVYAAAVTPLKPDFSPDLEAIPHLLGFLAGRGCHGALVLGTTGEGPSFSPAEREAIWRGIYPAATPTEELDVAALAQLNVAGGDIRNIALKAAFLAADAGQPVRMAHLLKAARREYTKLERPLTGAEMRGWDEAEH